MCSTETSSFVRRYVGSLAALLLFVLATASVCRAQDINRNKANPAWWVWQRGTGPAGQFEIRNSNNMADALKGTSIGSGNGVHGVAGALASGVLGENIVASGNAGNGVSGTSIDGQGVYGQSTNADAFYGRSVNGDGGYFSSNSLSGHGVLAGNGATGAQGWIAGAMGITGVGTVSVGVHGGASVGILGEGSLYAGYFNGNLAYTGSLSNPSDARYKTDVTTLPDALSKVMAVRGTYFSYNAAAFPQMRFSHGRQIGLIAQDVEKVLPEIVSKNKMGYLSVDYTKMTPVLVEAVKEQQREIVVLKAKVETLSAGTPRQAAVNRADILGGSPTLILGAGLVGLCLLGRKRAR